ncbi:spore coat protein [Cohnella caldifontis]|uniref:spore coat protein n=1 Tax=Cohnella caldifontis TaxID=3027471 RepID=UPI0023EA9644|nr:spore coat protein [Cohnella sp. YIM B05605]
MPFGAHETMEAHELLCEKINRIAHFNLYAQQARNPQLKEMINRHRQEAIRSYNEIVAYTHDYNAAPQMGMHQPMGGINPGQIQYGLHNPQPVGPETNTTFSDQEIASAMLICHKNGAKNAMMGAVECADPHLRRMMMNSSVACADQAYETFLFMNQQGLYQVPTLNDHTAKTFMHAYQPMQQTQQMQQMQQMQPMQQQIGNFGAGHTYGAM